MGHDSCKIRRLAIRIDYKRPEISIILEKNGFFVALLEKVRNRPMRNNRHYRRNIIVNEFAIEQA